jgi:hypothetical protein
VFYKKTNKQYVKAATLLTCIRETLGSCLIQDTDNPVRVLSLLFFIPFRQIPKEYFLLVTTVFSHASQFIIARHPVIQTYLEGILKPRVPAQAWVFLWVISSKAVKHTDICTIHFNLPQ